MCSSFLRGLLSAAASSLVWHGAGFASARADDDHPRSADAPAEDAQRPEIELPRLISDAGATYPAVALRAQFYERVDVELTLELDGSGRVTRAHVVTARGRG